MDRPALRQMQHRMLDLVERGTTEMSEGTTTVPVADYLDGDRWQREMDQIFRQVPLLLAFGGELPEPGDFKSMDVMGTPVLLTRGADGEVRGFLNVCRHRGAIVTGEGCGNARRHACPYHGWTYDTAGTLVGLPGQEGFEDLDRSTRGLTELPVAERAGIIFGQVTPGLALDVDDWLGGLDEMLAPLDIGSWRPHEVRTLDGPNWKVCYDGYLEGYHFASLHCDTLHRQIMSNVMCFDSFGPHQRVGFARQGIERLRDKPEDEWSPFEGISIIVTFFPHCSLVLSSDGGFLSQLWPGSTPDTSTTTQTMFRSDEASDEDAALVALQADFLYGVVRDEDYATGNGIQRALASGATAKAGETFVFGANEQGNQRFHRTVARLLEPQITSTPPTNRPIS